MKISKETLDKLIKKTNENYRFPKTNLQNSKMTFFEYIFKFGIYPYTIAEFTITLSQESIDKLDKAGSSIHSETMFVGVEGDAMEDETILFNLVDTDDEEGEEGRISISLDGEILATS